MARPPAARCAAVGGPGGALTPAPARCRPGPGPRRRDTGAWRALTALLHAGVRFHKSCCGGPGWRPRALPEVRERLVHARRTGEPAADALLRRELPRAVRGPHRRTGRGAVSSGGTGW
ncbi:hypothetical protein [Streptomyces sp. NPDC059816]|uniref:hypothetical protein n=1 Tax=Streptomyces sp. NPDC059816 TaxID=3346960 RepID=UPI0036536D30